jgi:hypothetical protein
VKDDEDVKLSNKELNSIRIMIHAADNGKCLCSKECQHYGEDCPCAAINVWRKVLDK